MPRWGWKCGVFGGKKPEHFWRVTRLKRKLQKRLSGVPKWGFCTQNGTYAVLPRQAPSIDSGTPLSCIATIDAEFDHGFTSESGLERLRQLKARVVEEYFDSCSERVREVAGPRRDESARVRLSCGLLWKLSYSVRVFYGITLFRMGMLYGILWFGAMSRRWRCILDIICCDYTKVCGAA